MLSSSHLPTSKRLNFIQKAGNPLLKLSAGVPTTNSVYILPSGLTKKVIANSRGSMRPLSGRKPRPFSALPVQRTWTTTLKPTKLCMQITIALAAGNVSNAKAMKVS